MRALIWLPFLLTTFTSASQLPFSTPAPAPAPTSTSLIDLLSLSPNHTLLVQAFQRARLVPVINRLNGSTLFAPSDEAIKREREREKSVRGEADGVWAYAMSEESELEALEGDERDNLQLELRDTLLYHVLNYTLFPAPEPTSPPPSTNDSASSSLWTTTIASTLPLDTPTLQETLFNPALNPFNKSFPAPPSLPGSPPDDPDPDKPKNHEGLLRGEGQRVRVTRKGKGKSKEIWVGGDWKGEGGVLVVKDSLQFASNGALVVLDGVLQKPVDLATQIRTNPRLSVLASLLPPALLDYISTVSHMTLFAPTNEAWGALSPLELRYLQSGFAEKDLIEIFGDVASQNGAGKGRVGYLSTLLGSDHSKSSNVSTIFGSPLEVTAEGEYEVKVNGSSVEEGDILAKNGVIHTVPSLLLPSGSLSLTAEKYLIALNATRFVALLRSVNLSHYVQVPSGEGSTPLIDPTVGTAKITPDSFTILATTDEVMDAAEWAGGLGRSGFEENVEVSAFGTKEDDERQFKGGKGLPNPGSEALKHLLSYHILAGKWTTDDLRDGMLVGTELRGEELRGARQRVAVSVHVAEEQEREGGGWWNSGKGKPKNPGKPDGVVAFGGASVVADPVVVGNSIIYLMSSVLEPPAPLVTTAVSDLRLSTFVASIYAASLDKALTRAPAITYLVPSNDAFTSLGLVMSYLLLPVARLELRSLIRYHAINEVVYLDDFPVGGSKRYPTLSGAEIFVERSSENSSLAVHGPTVGGLPANGETRDGRVVEGDILTATGALHIIDQVELPPDLDIGIAKLLKGAKANTMPDLIRAANLSWILEGEEPPESFLDGSDQWELLRAAGLNKGKKKPKKRTGDGGVGLAKANRAYTILCPTDKALARLNLTYYLSNPVALSSLVRLHIVPTDAFAPLSSDGRPIPLEDEATFPTLLANEEGGTSKYGTVAFRRWGEDGWLVGIKSARGTNGQSDSARVVASGRATPGLRAGEGDETRLAGGGGVLTIDNVLIPYEPGWWTRWGWIVALVLVGVLLAGCVGLLGVKAWRGKHHLYVPVEGEED